jgi:hypothetical protein
MGQPMRLGMQPHVLVVVVVIIIGDGSFCESAVAVIYVDFIFALFFVAHVHHYYGNGQSGEARVALWVQGRPSAQSSR